MDFMFGNPGSSFNMLATPIHRFIVRTTLVILWHKYLMSWLWESRYAANPRDCPTLPCVRGRN